MFLSKNQIDLYLDIAKRTSRESTIGKAQVGCLNLYSNGIMSIGWNQMTPRPFTEVHTRGAKGDRLHSIHAETMASTTAWQSGTPTKHHHKFITQEPCLSCAKQAVAEGASTVVFEAPYGVVEGVRYLHSQGVDVVVRKAKGARPTEYFLLHTWYQGIPSSHEWMWEYGMYGEPLFQDDTK